MTLIVGGLWKCYLGLAIYMINHEVEIRSCVQQVSAGESLVKLHVLLNAEGVFFLQGGVKWTRAWTIF
jgi:hypothetical protein